MDIEVANRRVSGPKNRRCAFIANRFDSEFGFRPGDGESWIGFNDYTLEFEGLTRLSSGTAALYSGIWSTMEGSVYVTRHDGWILRNSNVFGPDLQSTWQDDHLDNCTLWGVFGIDDENVFVWGDDSKAHSQLVYPPSVILRRAGNDWKPMPAPGFQVIAMHGTSPDNLWVASPSGEIARWNGTTWQNIGGVKGAVHSLWVAGPDEAYATTSPGAVVHISGAGIRLKGNLPGAAIPGDAACVAKWQGQLWLGSPRLGLFRQAAETQEFECIKPNILCVSMDAREELVLCAPNRIAGTADGIEFRAYGNDVVQNVRAPHKLCQNMG